ncbi:MAG: DNA polymerase III subunit alpha [Bdellovibrionales bacterium]|nr:DNA polymerase III subunit alpha [Bdellovibrionales bacterium]
MSFAHLHVHTAYSFLQGTIKTGDLVKKAKEYGMPAVAITDTNNMFGAIDFYFACKDAGIKAIIGCDLVYCPEGRDQVFAEKGAGTTNKHLHSLVVLCKDYNGYKNLCKMLTQAYQDGMNNKTTLGDLYRGVVDRELLDKYGDGLIVLSSSLRGQLGYLVMNGKDDEALKTAQWFKKRFSEDFYLEVVDNGIPEQESLNQRLVEIGEREGIQLVGTSESYYLDPSYAEAQEVLQCIPLGRNLDIERPKSLVQPEFYLKSPDQMRERLSAYPSAYENTIAIADKCKLEFKFKDAQGKSIYHLPDFRPEGVAKSEVFDTVAYFKKQSREGLEKRFLEPEFNGPDGKRKKPEWATLEKEYRERLEQELAMIEKTGFSGYFLIVSDFIKWAKSNDIPVGPGRGSGAGSLVAYALFITDIDPIEFKLLFERFINPERVSMPDFDIDFCQDRRGLVIEYVERKYGKDKVSQIITFGKLQAKAVIKDVGRVLGLQFAETNQITNLFPNELNIKLKDAYDNAPDLKTLIEADPKLQKVWEYSLKLEGMYRNAGIHAAGVIITEEPIVSYCPLYVTKDGDVVTMFDKDYSEKIGLIKYDFLGLKTLTVIDNAAKFIRAQEGLEKFDLKAVSYKDQKVFEFISSGATDGVFQVESSGMKELCKGIQPNSLEDLTAINALYRPGPLGSGMVPDFIDRKHGRKETNYELPELAPILSDTYGVILYQEQVMQIARDIAGYSLGQADLLRRAMGKKKADEMAKHKEIFVKGATAKGVPEQKASDLFDLMAKFAEYGFNKSHSAAYGVITYQTAYLKTYYPVEFMAALMTTEMSDTDKLAKYTADARSLEIPVLPPDVNTSLAAFTVEGLKEIQGRGSLLSPEGYDKAVRFGLEAIKGVGGAAVEAILEARQNGRFESPLDFVKRVSMRKVNKKVLESLILSGAMDSIALDGLGQQINRPSLFASIEALMSYGQDEQAKAELGQSSLFEDFKAEEVRLTGNVDTIIRKEADWPLARRLLSEKQVLGFFISGHPMQNWQSICNDWLGTNTDRLREMAQAAPAPVPQGGEGQWGRSRPKRKEVKIAGIVGEFKEITTKKGSRMAFFQLEDLNGRVEVIAFPDFYAANIEALAAARESPEPIMITGEFDVKEGEPKVLASGIQRLEEAHGGREVTVVLEIDPSKVAVDQLRSLKQFILQNRGKSPLKFKFLTADWKANLDLQQQVKVSGTPQFAAGVNKIFGHPVAKLQ